MCSEMVVSLVFDFRSCPHVCLSAKSKRGCSPDQLPDHSTDSEEETLSKQPSILLHKSSAYPTFAAETGKGHCRPQGHCRLPLADIYKATFHVCIRNTSW
eukprot:jgi/Chrzof1/1468/Cz10g09010.t1